MMYYRVIILVAVLAFGFTFAEAKTYKIASGAGPLGPPVERILRKAYGLIGHDVEFVHLPAKRRLLASNAGDLDAELARIRGMEKEFKNLVRVEEPIFLIKVVAVVGKNSKAKISGWDDLKSHQFAYQRGLKVIEKNTAGMNRVAVKKVEQVLKMVRAGRLSVGVVFLSNARRFISQIGGYRIMEKPLQVVLVYHYVHKKNKDIIPLLNKAIKSMRKSGQIELFSN